MNNKNLQHIIDNAYDEYISHYVGYADVPVKELFIHEIKTNVEFSNRQGLKIEERIMTTPERNEWFDNNWGYGGPKGGKNDWKGHELDQQNVPTKQITVTYNNQIIESYE